MKIIAVETWPVETQLTEPYTIAYETFSSVTNIFIRIETDCGIHGYGCASPAPSVTGETTAMVLETFKEDILPVLRGSDPLQRARLMDRFQPLVLTRPATAAMVDMALWDILGKTSGLPVYKLLGGFRDCIPTSITIGILPIEDTVAKARELVKKGFRALKLKGGKDVEEDIQRVVKVREVVGKDIQLRFDANQGYSVADAVTFGKGAKDVNIELMEQPTPKENPQLLGDVRKEISIPVMADESLLSLADALFMAKHQLVDMINIKLMKTGGISEALKIDAVAQAAGQTVMVGCMDESALAISAGLHLTLARPNIQYADLDGHLDLEDDPTAGTVILKDGLLYPNGKPGLGWSGHKKP
ncbi:MAG: dipeptide epimerase [bacterium]|nr:dipeptide epimerase [bacterium]